MSRSVAVAMLLWAGVFASATSSAQERQARAAVDAAAGRALALTACSGCHVVLPDQPFAPLLTGLPDFRTIANRPQTTAVSLRRFLSGLHVVPPPGQMAQTALTDTQIDDVVAFVMTLKDPR